MLGQYNVENFGLALMTLCTHFGEDFFPDERVFKSFCPPPGRMEPVILNKKPIAYVDYSHTPDSLQKALETLKPLGQKVFVVFGCGGNRDQNKRAKMGAVASELSDFCFVTSDNPRDEDPDQIINDITKGFKGDDFIAVENRKDAIKKALDKAIGDQALVLIAGKGHEETQELKGKKIFFSDIEEVKKWVKKHED